VALVAALGVPAAGLAQETGPGADAVGAASARGPVTNLPLPRYVSLKAGEGNVRRGPSLSHRIDWVFVRRDMPLEVTGEYGHWRRVRDRDGAGGWIHYSLLSGVRTVVTTRPLGEVRARPAADAPLVARTEAGVVARLGACEPAWCLVTAGRHRGWIEKSAVWGVAEDEVRD
jgi:SH3-like domain-containing protein